MKHLCKIERIDDEEIQVQINGVELICFCNAGCKYNVGDEVKCELILYDDLDFEETMESESIERVGETYSYHIIGKLDVERKTVNSSIEFSLDEADIWDVSYLDHKMISFNVVRIDIEFD